MGRYDNVKVWNGSSWVAVNEIKVHNGSSFETLGTADGSTDNLKNLYSYHTGDKKYYRILKNKKVTNIPNRIEIGNGKYIKLAGNKDEDRRLPVDTYHKGYLLQMDCIVNATTPLYSVYTKNQGDIENQAYVNYIAEVKDNKVRIRVKSYFSGYEIGTHRWVNGYSTDKVTSYVNNLKGKRIIIKFYSKKDTGDIYVVLDGHEYNLGDVCTSWVYNPNKHRIGCKTTNKSGDMSTGGSTYLYSFKTTPVDDRDSVSSFTTSSMDKNDSDKKYKLSGYGGWAVLKGTGVYGENKVEWI